MPGADPWPCGGAWPWAGDATEPHSAGAENVFCRVAVLPGAARSGAGA